MTAVPFAALLLVAAALCRRVPSSPFVGKTNRIGIFTLIYLTCCPPGGYTVFPAKINPVRFVEIHVFAPVLP
jgi:hypothetical protein